MNLIGISLRKLLLLGTYCILNDNKLRNDGIQASLNHKLQSKGKKRAVWKSPLIPSKSLVLLFFLFFCLFFLSQLHIS